MKKVYGYTRVSTAKQGEGVSLVEQKNSIERYALKNDLKIVRWFEEKETAAKSGRPVFTEMLWLLKRRRVDGVIIHKIDRSARNLSDWAKLGDLIDIGVDVHFSFEAIDFNTRGGRLSADIQAVIAADYIRNLREETKKGLYGRLKQGIYPFDAPIGYLNTGGGNLKEIDTVKAPLVRDLFELYASGLYSIIELVEKMYELGLRNRNGNKVTRNGISHILHNSFYIGIIKLRKNGMVFKGNHTPLISQKLFMKSQEVMKGKTKNSNAIKHDYLYRRCIKCGSCDKALIAEKQKGNIYYRCHTQGCLTKSIREDLINIGISDFLSKLHFSSEELVEIENIFRQSQTRTHEQMNALKKEYELKLIQLKTRLDRLTDKLIDGVIDNDIYLEKKNELLNDEAELRDNLNDLLKNNELQSTPIKLIKLLKNIDSVFLQKDDEGKRTLLKLITSNLKYTPKKLVIETHLAFSWLLNSDYAQYCGQMSDIPRTFSNAVEYKVTKNKDGQTIVPKKKTPNKNKAYLKQVALLLHYESNQCHKVMEGLEKLYRI